MIIVYFIKTTLLLIFNLCLILGTLYLITEFNWPWWSLLISVLLLNIISWFQETQIQQENVPHEKSH
jgi:hypothetical protein